MQNALVEPNIVAALPFVLLLAAIALAPFFFADWWGRNYPKVALALAAIVVLYYAFGLHDSQRVVKTAREYFSFIALIGSLFIVSGGIHIRVKGEATPGVNVLFLLIGAVVANLLGTTGASMLLIRPWIRMNKFRITGHHVVFFILIVSNVGGCLTPIGDPPLFLGYLYGVPFWWVARQCLPMWLIGVGILLLLFYIGDRANFAKVPRAVRELETAGEDWLFEGMRNLAFLAIIILAVFINRPPFVRELLMLSMAALSWFATPKRIHESNHFSFGPIKEVAILFIGIFATMMPALDWLAAHAGTLLGAIPPPALFYWGSGTLSSMLDNAPTYLSFLSAVFGSFVNQDVVAQVQHLVQTGGADLAAIVGPHAEDVRRTFTALQQFHHSDVIAHTVTSDEIQTCFLLGSPRLSAYIVAISIGSVFFGANTYIGNGPNFLVKAIADHQQVHSPSFLAYIVKFTLPIMLPMLLVVWWIFFRN